MFLIDIFCCSSNDCGAYNNEFRSKYSLWMPQGPRYNIKYSLWIRFCSESQTIEDFGRELRLQRADVEHLRRWDSLHCRRVREASVQCRTMHSLSCSVETEKRRNKVQKSPKNCKSYQIKGGKVYVEGVEIMSIYAIMRTPHKASGHILCDMWKLWFVLVFNGENQVRSEKVSMPLMR